MKFKESETVELKRSLSQLEDFLRTVCVFLNHKGGVIKFIRSTTTGYYALHDTVNDIVNDTVRVGKKQ